MDIIAPIKIRTRVLKNKILSAFDSAFEKISPKATLSDSELQEYRKKIKVYDVFNFFNELELLEIRLAILDPYVDYFVLVESTLTHSGKEKELYFKNNKHLFQKYNHKIIHYVIREPLRDFVDARERLTRSDLPPLEREILTNALRSDTVPKDKPHFLRDFYEKESIKNALVGLSDTDFCYISDLDEIWNPDCKIDYSSSKVFKFRQLSYYYYLNNRCSEEWTGTTATKYGNIKNSCVNHVRNKGKTRQTIVEHGGWHFTYQGGFDRVQKKLEAYSHQEFNNEETKSKVADRLKNNIDVVGRGFTFWVDDSELPEYLKEHKGEYAHLFK